MTRTVYGGKGEGYAREDGLMGMVRCFQCGLENYAPSVHSGVCAFCGYDCNKEVVANNKEAELAEGKG